MAVHARGRWSTARTLSGSDICGGTSLVATPSTETGQAAHLYLHRAILGLAPGDPRRTDHKNRNRLDNRRENLRVVTHAENLQNLPLASNNTSGCRGVSWDKRRGCWYAYGGLSGRRRHLGRFPTLDVACAAASEWRASHTPCSEEAAA